VDMTFEEQVRDKFVRDLVARYQEDCEGVTDAFELSLLHNMGIMPKSALEARRAAATAITAPYGRTGHDDLRIGDAEWVPFSAICMDDAAPEWPTEPFIYHKGRWSKIRSPYVWEEVVNECETYIAVERDYADGTFTVRERSWSEDHAAWDAVVGAPERKAEHVGNMMHAVKRKMRLMRSYGSQSEGLEAERLRAATLEAELATLPPSPAARVTMRLGELEEARAAFIGAYKWNFFPLPPKPVPPLRPPLQIIPVELCDVDAHGRLWPPAVALTDGQVAQHGRRQRAFLPRRRGLAAVIDDAIADAYPSPSGPFWCVPTHDVILKKLAEERWWAEQQEEVAKSCAAQGIAPVDYWRQQRANPPPHDPGYAARREEGIRAAFEATEADKVQAEKDRLAAVAAKQQANRAFMRSAIPDGAPDIWRVAMMGVIGMKLA
jgi:hypothetical protein